MRMCARVPILLDNDFTNDARVRREVAEIATALRKLGDDRLLLREMGAKHREVCRRGWDWQ